MRIAIKAFISSLAIAILLILIISNTASNPLATDADKFTMFVLIFVCFAQIIVCCVSLIYIITSKVKKD